MACCSVVQLALQDGDVTTAKINQQVQCVRLLGHDNSSHQQSRTVAMLSRCAHITELAFTLPCSYSHMLDLDSPFITTAHQTLSSIANLETLTLSFTISSAALAVLLRSIAADTGITNCTLSIDVRGSIAEDNVAPLLMDNLKKLTANLRGQNFTCVFPRYWTMPNLRELELNGSAFLPPPLKPLLTFTLTLRTATHLAVPYWALPLIDAGQLCSIHRLTVLGDMCTPVAKASCFEDALFNVINQLDSYYEEIYTSPFFPVGIRESQDTLPALYLLAFLGSFWMTEAHTDSTTLFVKMHDSSWGDIKQTWRVCDTSLELWQLVFVMKDILNHFADIEVTPDHQRYLVLSDKADAACATTGIRL